MDLDPPLPHYLTSDPTSFAYTSARHRWPAILTSAIDDVHRTISASSSSDDNDNDAKTKQGKLLVSSLASLKYELQHNRALTPLEDDGESDVGIYNEELRQRGELQQQNNGGGVVGDGGSDDVKWHDVEWLFSECYLYRRISSLFRRANEWKDYDCFARQKMDTFRSSRPAVVELAGRYSEIVRGVKRRGSVVVDDEEGKKSKEELEEEAEKVLFIEMAEICLWGNATDLSLLTSLSYEDIQKLQGSETKKEREKMVLVNELPEAFRLLYALKKEGRERRRVDIVLDNAGFELFVDLVLAGFLIETGLATEVVMHPKSIPWFVSDVVPKDLAELLRVMGDPKGFYENTEDGNGKPLAEKEEEDIRFLFEHWSGLHQEGQLILRPNRFWTHPGSFWRMPKTAPALFEDLKESELVIFKGDLNYRKLCGDVSETWSLNFVNANKIGCLGSDHSFPASHRTSGQIVRY